MLLEQVHNADSEGNGKCCIADKGKDHGVGVERTDAAKGGEWRIEVQLREEQLTRN